MKNEINTRYMDNIWHLHSLLEDDSQPEALKMFFFPTGPVWVLIKIYIFFRIYQTMC